jgi:hypothetical protein
MKVDVTEVNTSPTTTSYPSSTHVNTPVSINLIGVDSDVPTQTLAYSIVTPPTNGTLGAISGNNVTYSPNSNFTGNDSFSYKVNDGVADSNVSTITIAVSNNAPTLDPISNVTADELTFPTVTAVGADPDGDPLTYSILNAPAFASLSGNVLTLSPGETQDGIYSGVVMTVSDGVLSTSQTFDITINEVNIAPVASNVSTSTVEDTATSVTFSATDSDVPVQALTYSIVTNPAHGTLSAVSGDSVVYTPAANYNGADSFTYKANDGVTDSNVATVDVSISAVNDAPIITLNGSSTIALLVGDTYNEQGATASDVEDPSLTVITTGSATTTVPATFTITYSVTDTGGLSATTTRTVVVSNALDTTPPVITLNGSSTITLNVGDTYHEPGATAFDNVDGNLTSSIVISGTPDMTSPTTNYVIYTVTDSSGNTASTTRTVIYKSQNNGGGGGGGGNGIPFQPGSTGGYGGGRIGEVLGAEISAEQLAACMKDPYLTDYLKLGAKNKKDQVEKLQTFLNDLMGSKLPVTGYFGPLTFQAVKNFQAANKDQVLTPWVTAKAATDDAPSGYVYKTTKRWINILKCKELEAITPMPQLP